MESTHVIIHEHADDDDDGVVINSSSCSNIIILDADPCCTVLNFSAQSECGGIVAIIAIGERARVRYKLDRILLAHPVCPALRTIIHAISL